MENLLNKRIKSISPSGIRKFFDIANQMENVISLGVGEPDFRTPWHVRAAAVQSIEQKGTSYTANAGLLELRKAISRYLEDRFQLEYNPENQILVTVGASEAVDLALRAIVEEGDEILIPEPTYVSYLPSVVLAGGVAVPVPTYESRSFRLTAEDLEKHITPRTKAIVMCYPNNPTGAVMELSDLKAIGEVLKEHDIFVISDEIYSELVYGITHTSIASLPGMAERTLVINGFSKSFAMTGWRLGYAAGPVELLQAMTKIHQYAIMCAPTMSQYAGLEALENGLSHVKTMVAEYNQRRRVMVDGFRQMGLSCFEPQGAFYVFPRISDLGLSSDEFCTQLLQEERVAVVPGIAFGASGEGFIRCSYAYSLDSIREALRRIDRFVTHRRRVSSNAAN
ncbi:MAG: aminotransferase class I/II-fold pyridoxal phosphate-dependent enzyme [Firmicutes bacterium]|nr:aminotransferase class I/II-fold pyridoxal phosphate-dependent enzyme [Bacillota bacterium]